MSVEVTQKKEMDESTYRILKEGLTSTFRNAIKAQENHKTYDEIDAKYTLAAAEAGRALIALESFRPPQKK
jgi:hypothetical protein